MTLIPCTLGLLLCIFDEELQPPGLFDRLLRFAAHFELAIYCLERAVAEGLSLIALNFLVRWSCYMPKINDARKNQTFFRGRQVCLSQSVGQGYF